MRKNENWLELLRRSFEADREYCHGGCGDKAEELRLYGKHVGAWCLECWREVAHGTIPRPGRPKRRR